MQSNLLFVLFVIFVAFIALAVRIGYLNQKDGQRYGKRVLSQQSYMNSILEYKRGDILDRNNTKLATSRLLYNVIIDPKAILADSEYKEPTLSALTSCFDLEREELEKTLAHNPKSQYAKVLKNVTKDQVDAFEKMQEEEEERCEKMDKKCDIVGVWFEKSYKRIYPLKEIACSVIGFSGADNNGLWGLENQYNSELNGVAGRSYGYYNQNSELERTVKAAENGNSIVTTLDSNIQSIVEKKIDKFMNHTGAKEVAVLVMNPNNGEIYAMSSNIHYDLNNAFDLTEAYPKSEVEKMTDEEKSEQLNIMWRNYCVSVSYEPGSTFKPLTVAAALEENLTNNNAWFVCNGGESIAGETIKCVNRYGHGSISLEQSLMSSCNDVMMQLASKMGKKTFSKYQNIFNIGRKTGIDLPGEISGLKYAEEDLGPTELATSSFGQSLTVNMVQIASAISSVINGGNYYQPHVVKQILDEDGNVIENIDGTVLRKTVSKQTSDLIRKYMLATVEDGTGATAQIKGYSIGGKTGTAEKYPRGQGNYLVSFIGAVPMEKPEVVVYAIVDEPAVEDQAHSTYAQSIVKDVMKDILPFLGIYRDESKVTSDEKESETEEPLISTEGSGEVESGLAVENGEAESGQPVENGEASSVNTQFPESTQYSEEGSFEQEEAVAYENYQELDRTPVPDDSSAIATISPEVTDSASEQ